MGKVLSVFLLSSLLAGTGSAFPSQLGDLNGDGVVDVRDLVMLINHINGTVPLPPALVPYADIDQDGQVSQIDAGLLANIILGLAPPAQLPLAHLLKSSPAQGETDVSVTRPTVFKLTMPLSATAVVTTNNVYATFGGRHFLSWVALSADRQTVSLFYQEPLPGAALIRVVFDGTGLTDFLGRPLDLSQNGTPGGQVILDFDTLNNNALVGTSVAGRVFASELATVPGSTNDVNQPLAGVTITVDGQEQTLRAVTDQFGNFRLDPAPSGDFFVHIDGRTATNAIPGGGYPTGAYYPYVGKEWTGTPGEEVNIGNIYLPLIAAGTLQPVSATQPTAITFPTSVLQQYPQLNGVTLNVPANDLFSDDGTRGGSVGLAPVPPDRLPSPLPAGLQFSLVITVQSDGPLNFDQPVSACFPNLPDPTTGQVLLPGAKSALWSFNHRDGRWEIQGSMTVSADGRLVCTDPGVGISFPGWHGTAPGSTGFGGLTGTGGGQTTQKPPHGCQPQNATDPLNLFSGEFQTSMTDLLIRGRGMDFDWSRTYSSIIGPNSPLGNRWDSSIANVYLELQGTNLLLHEGTGRSDPYSPQPDGTFAAPGIFRSLAKNPDGTYSLTFGDRGQWQFYALDGSPSAGKRSAIVDRNGNALSYFYDAQGRLNRVSDTLNRAVLIAYNPQGYIASVTDFTGRSVTYSYYDGVEPGGNAGDLKSVTTPAVTGTPNGNDFPNGKTTTYTYSTGFAADRLNHNLLTITDGRRNDTNDLTYGQGPYLVNLYASTVDPTDPNFDRVVRQIWGGNFLDIVYVPILPSNPNGNAVMKTIVRDRNGNVKEYFYDTQNRMVRTREYTGRADPTQPTSEFSNRPTNKLRATDPDYFETITEWTPDSREKSVTYPNGNITENIYEADLNPLAAARTRGNLRQVTHLPGTHLPAGDQPLIQESYEYDTDFGSCCGFNFVVSETDGRGNVTSYQYDSNGNRIRTLHAIAGVNEDWTYNPYGQMTSHTWPPDASGYRRVDTQDYYTNGVQQGYLLRETQDANGLQLITTFEYNPLGEVVRLIDARGNDTQRILNALNQPVRVLSPEVIPGTGIRYTRDYFYDANNNVVRVDVLNLDENGVVQPKTNFTTLLDFEILNQPIRISVDIDATRAAVTEFAYDANRNRVLVRQPEAVSGRQTANLIQTFYDERDLPFQVIGALGDPTQSTSQTDYDGNGNPVRAMDGLEATPHVALFEYDGYDRLVATTDAMGNVRSFQRDASHNIVHSETDGEIIDLPGSSNNVRLAELTRTFDALNRLIRVDEMRFDPASQQSIGRGVATTLLEYSPNSRLVRQINDNGNTIDLVYDTATRLVSLTDAKSNQIVKTYDARGNLLTTVETDKSDLGGPEVVFTNTYAYDNLNRLVRMTDNAGDINDFAYDSRNNRVLEIDAARSSAAASGNQTRRQYDGLSRLVQVSRELTSDGTGQGTPVGQIVLQRAWDDDGRAISILDANSNATQFFYDPLDRVIQTVTADGATQFIQYDPHSDRVSITDRNGTVVRQTFDALDRVIRRDITPGAGVAADTRFETWTYDGLSEVSGAVNDSTAVSLSYDSLGNLTKDNLDGRVVQRAYDGVGNPVTTIYPGGRSITGAYDQLEQLSALSDTTSANPVPLANYYYSGRGRLVRRANGNNTLMDIAYDSALRPIRSTHSDAGGAAFEDRDYAWDPNSNQTLNRDRLAGGFTQNYAYDSAYRLVSATFTGALNLSRNYQLDAAGNRVAVTGSGDVGTYTRAIAPARDAVLNQYSTTPFDQRLYDTNGNLIQITAAGQPRNLQFDYRNLLVLYTANGITNHYQYDALGRRAASLTDNGAVNTRFCYLGAQMIEEQNPAGATVATYVFGPDLNGVVSMQRNGSNYWLHADELLSVRRATDANGQVVEKYSYDEFGTPTVFDPSGRVLAASAVGNPYLFTGQHYDPETGFYYARNRYYEPRSGRFITRDPAGAFGDPLSLGNAFTYAGNNPATYADPMGLSALQAAANGYAAAAANKAAIEATKRANQLLNQASKATAEAQRINDTMGKELMQWFDAANNEGILVDAAKGTENSLGTTGTELVMEGDILKSELSAAQGGPDADLLRRTFASDEEAAAFVNARYTQNIRNHSYLEQMTQKGQALEDEGAQLAQKGSRLKTAGKALGIASVALQTVMAVSEDRKNCADTVTTISDAGCTIIANGAVYAVPGVGTADLVTGGAVSGGIHNACMTVTVVAKLRYGRISNRDANAIKATYTRFAVGRWAWDAGEYWANTGPVSWLADKIVGN